MPHRRAVVYWESWSKPGLHRIMIIHNFLSQTHVHNTIINQSIQLLLDNVSRNVTCKSNQRAWNVHLQAQVSHPHNSTSYPFFYFSRKTVAFPYKTPPFAAWQSHVSRCQLRSLCNGLCRICHVSLNVRIKVKTRSLLPLWAWVTCAPGNNKVWRKCEWL